MEIEHAYADRGVVVVALSIDHDNETHEGVSRLAALRDFVREEKPAFPILLPSEQSPLMTSTFPIPQTLLFDKHGRRAQRILGGIDKKAVEQSIDQMLQEP